MTTSAAGLESSSPVAHASEESYVHPATRVLAFSKTIEKPSKRLFATWRVSPIRLLDEAGDEAEVRLGVGLHLARVELDLVEHRGALHTLAGEDSGEPVALHPLIEVSVDLHPLPDPRVRLGEELVVLLLSHGEPFCWREWLLPYEYFIGAGDICQGTEGKNIATPRAVRRALGVYTMAVHSSRVKL